MASIVYPAIIFVFLMGAGITMINDMGLYGNTKLPDSGIHTDAANANQTSQALQYEAQHPSATSTWNQMGIAFHSVWGGVAGLLSVGLLLESLGIPTGIVGFLISPLAIIIVFWVIEFWLGRSPE